MSITKQFACYLNSMIDTNSDLESSSYPSLQCFCAKKIPSITINDYIDRFTTYLKTDESIFVVALILIERLIKQNNAGKITALNVHRLIVVGITIAETILNDLYWRNTDYAMVGAITNEELKKLEREFRSGIEFNLEIEQESVINTLAKIERSKNDVKKFA